MGWFRYTGEADVVNEEKVFHDGHDEVAFVVMKMLFRSQQLLNQAAIRQEWLPSIGATGRQGTTPIGTER